MIRHGKWIIRHDPPPIPWRSFDWSFVHDDFDGAPDANDNRCGAAASVAECIERIEEIEADLADRAAHKAERLAEKRRDLEIDREYD